MMLKTNDFFNKLGKLFLFAVVLPTAVATIYFGLIASDVYVSESRYVVRSPEKQAATGLGILMKSAGFSNAGGDEIYAANDYILSRNALQAANRDGFVAKAFGDPSASAVDRFNGFGTDGSFEELYRFYSKMVRLEHEASPAIATLRVRAFSAKDAQALNLRLLEQTEALVNRLNERGQKDLIRFAEAEVDEAKAKAAAAATDLARFRNKAGVVDPERQATVELQIISKLQDDLIASKTQLYQLRTVAPINPQIPMLEARVRGLAAEISNQMGRVTGGSNSLAGNAVEYQRLQLESQFADKQLAGAMTSLQEARNEARRKQAYVERVVQPNMPDKALEPRRLRGIFATFVIGLVAWGIIRLLYAGVREHQA